MVSRAERTFIGEWWWTVDRVMLGALGCLMVAGLVFLMAGGPPVAERLGLSTFHFVNRQVLFLIPAIGVLLGTSFLPLRQVRRLALLVYLGAMVGIILAIKFGPEVKGAHRWLSFMGVSVQPSEFVKPAFVVLAAWFFSEGGRSDMPGTLLGFLILPVTIVPLILQPDFGQTMLLTMVWCGLFFTAGLHSFWVAGLGGVGAAAIFLAYEFVPHVRARILGFLDKSGSGDTFQVDTALESFNRGGFFGQGAGEGTVKRILPDAHTDFIFAVTAEEFGIIVCMGLVLLFAVIVMRGLTLARRNDEPFCRLAVTGLTLLFGFQAAINMMVNVHLMPAKGMTLPFVSYGGSSLISLALGMGFLIALSRKRPRAEYLDRIAPMRTRP